MQPQFTPTRRQLLRLAATSVLTLPAAAAAREPVYSDNPDSRYICVEPDCSPYVYDPAVGDPDRGFPPGTRFQDLPGGWFCPDCGAPKWQFAALD